MTEKLKQLNSHLLFNALNMLQKLNWYLSENIFELRILESIFHHQQ